jgi:hypothetical protein
MPRTIDLKVNEMAEFPANVSQQDAVCAEKADQESHDTFRFWGIAACSECFGARK